MQRTQPPASRLTSPDQYRRNLRRSGTVTPSTSTAAVEEINAYIVIRDGLLKEAEEIPTFAAIDRVAFANDVVQTCLRPARPVYRAQHLPENASVRELRRCKDVSERIAELRTAIG